MIHLSERLQSIAELVRDGAAICDIGCDHGYLAIELLRSGRVRSAIAADLRPLPLNTARENAARFGVELDLRLCDGLSGIKAGEADTVIIAGMGGEVIAGILSRCEWLKSSSVVLLLQAMTSAEILRDFLAENCFAVEAEPAVCENGKIYSVIMARYTGESYELSEAFRYIGKVSANSEAGAAYILKQRKRLAECAADLKQVPQKQSEFIRLNSAVKELDRILEGYYAV